MTAADKVLGDGIQPFQDMPREKQLRVSIWPPLICRQPLFKQPDPLRVVGLAFDRLRLPELAELPVNREREHPSQHLSVTGLRKGLGPDHLTDLSAAVQQIGDGNADTQVRFLEIARQLQLHVRIHREVAALGRQRVGTGTASPVNAGPPQRQRSAGMAHEAVDRVGGSRSKFVGGPCVTATETQPQNAGRLQTKQQVDAVPTVAADVFVGRRRDVVLIDGGDAFDGIVGEGVSVGEQNAFKPLG